LYTPFPVNFRVRLAWIGCCVLWGSTWLFIKLGLRDLPPLRFAAVRMSLAAAVLLPFAARAGLGGLARADLARVGFVGLLQIGIPYALLFAAQQWVASSLAAVLFATFPVWLLLIARVVLPGERLTSRKLVAAALGISGVLVLQLPALRAGDSGDRATVGGLLIVAAAIVVALANVLTRRGFHRIAPVVLTFVQVASGAALLVAVAALLDAGRAASWTARAAFAVGWLAVLGTALPYLMLFWLLPRIPVAAIGAIPLLDTTIAVCLGSLVLGEPLGWHLVAGGALVLGGAALANRTGAPEVPPALVRPAPHA
jgi:drug/metabolite transporter (DMT)-like permease